LREFRKSCIFTELAIVGSRRLSAQQISSHHHMYRRMLLPVVEELIDLPERKRVDLTESPAGSSCYVTIDERPVG